MKLIYFNNPKILKLIPDARKISLMSLDALYTGYGYSIRMPLINYFLFKMLYNEVRCRW